MSIDKKWSELSTVTTLPDTSFLALLDLTQSVDDQNQIISSLNAKTYFQQTLITTIDAQSNNITDLGSISFSDVDTSITQSINDLLYDVVTDGSHVLRINDVVVYSFNADTADFGTSDIVNVGSLGVGTDIPFAAIHALSTSEQLRLSYDDASYVSFTVSEGFNLSTASYDEVSFPIGSEDTNPRGIAFNTDGTKMFIIGTENDAVFQYSLTTAFDLSTASYDEVSFPIGSEDEISTGLTFNEDGTKMFTVGSNFDAVFQYTLTTAFDLSTASYDEVSFPIGSEDLTPTGLTFNEDGTKMFVVGASNDAVFQYTLTTAFDLSTASYDEVSFPIGSEDTNPRGIAFNEDGTKMYIVGSVNDTVFQYTLTTAFDLSTASYDDVSFPISSEDTNPTGLTFNEDGTKMFTVGNETNIIFQYSLLGSVDITPTSNILNLNSNVIIDGKLNNHTIPSGTSTFALFTDTLDVFASTSSSELAGVISDETGTGLLMFNDSPVIITPTITSFENALHSHEDTGGGGQLDSTSALSDTENIVYLNTTNTYDSSVEQNFGTSDIVNVGSLGVGTASPSEILHVNGGTILQNSGNPVLLDSIFPTDQNTMRGITVLGNFAYIAVFGTNSLVILDISDPENIIEDQIISDVIDLNGPSAVDVQGNYAYVACTSGDAVTIIDLISKSIVGTIVSNTELDGAMNIKVRGNYAFVISTVSDSFTIIDVSDPVNPVIESSVSDSVNMDSPNSLGISGDYAFVASSSSDMINVIDISDVTSPNIIQSLPVTDAAHLIIQKNYAYVTQLGNTAFSIIDITNPTSISIKSTLTDSTLDNSASLAISGDTAYFTNVPGNNLITIDISNKDLPTLLSTFTNTSFSGIRFTAIQGKNFYISNNVADSVLSLDISGINVPSAYIGDGEIINLYTQKFISEKIESLGDLTVTGTVLGKLSVNEKNVFVTTDEVINITTTSQFTSQATSDIITVAANEDLTNRFQITPITATEFIITGINSNLRLVDDGVDNFIVYTGTGTFITGVNGGICRVENIGLLAVAGGTLFDFTSTNRGNDIGSLFFSNCTLSGWNLGTISRDSTSEFGPIIDIDTSGFGNWNDSLIIDTAFFNVNKCIMEQSEGVTSNTSTFVIQNSAYKKGQASFRDIFGTLLAGETLVRIDAGIPDVQKVVLTGNLLDLDASDGLFDVSGDTGVFTAVTDNSISSTSINSVTDSNGVASFTHTGTSPALGSTVTISGFTTNTDYNTTGIVTSTTATTFEIDYVSFGTDEIGSYVSLGVTITATAHGLTQGTGITIDTTLSTDYDSGYLIYNIQTNSFDVAAVFTSNLEGTWSTEGLDQTDPRVLAFSNPGVQDSKVLAFGFINGNTLATTLIDGVYSSIDVSGFSEESITQRFKLINSTNGIFELTALEDFEGFLSGSLSATKIGNTENYRFTISTNSVIPTFATANYIPMEVQLTKINIPLEFFVSLSRGDTIQIMVAGDGTSDSLTVSDMVISVQ